MISKVPSCAFLGFGALTLKLTEFITSKKLKYFAEYHENRWR